MLVYEKKVNEGGELKRHLFGTMGNLPSENDVQLTYKDKSGTVITPVEKDTYRDDKQGGIVRDSDKKAVNVFIGDKCIIGKVEEPVVAAVQPEVKPVAAQAKPVEKKVVKEEKVEEPVKEEIKEEEVSEEVLDEE